MLHCIKVCQEFIHWRLDFAGTAEDEPMTYAELTSLDEFRTFGENVGKMLSARSNATHFSEMLISLLKVVLSNSKLCILEINCNLFLNKFEFEQLNY